MQAGTPAFQPPEQLKGEACGVGSDVYALACMIVEVFGGKPVWAGMSPHTIDRALFCSQRAEGNFSNCAEGSVRTPIDSGHICFSFISSNYLSFNFFLIIK